MADSLPDLNALRAKSAALRQQADEIDRKVAEFTRLADNLIYLTRATNASIGYSSGPMLEPMQPPRVRDYAGSHKPSGRGKPPGTLSMKWRGYFANIRLFDGVEFPLRAVIHFAKKADGSDQRPAALRRHMKPYIEHGYLIEVGDDLYRMTAKLEALLDKLDGSTGSADTSSPQGETGDVASPAPIDLYDTAACLTATGGGT